jgi:hypothetical protein
VLTNREGRKIYVGSDTSAILDALIARMLEKPSSNINPASTGSTVAVPDTNFWVPFTRSSNVSSAPPVGP